MKQAIKGINIKKIKIPKINNWNFKKLDFKKINLKEVLTQIFILEKGSLMPVITVVVCLIITIASIMYIKTTVNGMYSQRMGVRWADSGYSQISCFFSDKSDITEDRINNYHHIVENALTEDSIKAESENEKQVVSCYSARGNIVIDNNGISIEAKAIGVGGDFFLFHPIKLLQGSYYTSDDIMDDYIIVDEDAAWQLFGSGNIDGMTVYINGVPHIIKGVIRRDSGRINDYAGNNKATVYVSYNTLYKYGTCKEINTFEITLPNPVKSYAYNLIKKKIDIDEENMEVVDNSARYSLESLIKIIADFGSRSMNSKEIVYPYWENAARGYEDIFALLLVVVFIMDLAGVILVSIFIRKKWILIKERGLVGKE